MDTVKDDIICDTHKCNNYVELGIPSTETKCPVHRVIKVEETELRKGLKVTLPGKEFEIKFDFEFSKYGICKKGYSFLDGSTVFRSHSLESVVDYANKWFGTGSGLFRAEK
jgi:hypothetical protein